MKILFLLLFWCLWFLNFSTRTIFSPLLPIIEDEISLSHAMAGSLFVFLASGYTISLVLTGLLSPRLGYKRSILAGLVIMTVALFFVKYATSYALLAVFMFFVGIGTGIYVPSMIPIITATFGRRNWGRAIAFHETAASFSIFSIPILAAFGLRLLPWKTLFALLSGACLILLILFWMLAPDPRPEQKEERARFLDILGRRDFWAMSILWIFAVASTTGLYNVIPLFLVKERATPIETANTLFGISRIGGLFVSLLAGFLADRLGTSRVLFAVFLITGASTIGVALVRSLSLLLIMLAVQATVSVAFFPVALVAISRLTAFKERSLFAGATTAVGSIFGLGLTPVVLGAMADAWNFQSGILILGTLTIISCLSLRTLTEI